MIIIIVRYKSYLRNLDGPHYDSVMIWWIWIFMVCQLCSQNYVLGLVVGMGVGWGWGWGGGGGGGRSHVSHRFEQVEVDHVTWGCTKTRKKFPTFRSLGKWNKIWVYLKLIENKNLHVVPSWWSIIEPKTISVIYLSDIHQRKMRKISSYPVVHYLPLFVPYMSLPTEVPTVAFHCTVQLYY